MTTTNPPITESELRGILRALDKKGIRRASDIRRLVAFVRSAVKEQVTANQRLDIVRQTADTAVRLARAAQAACERRGDYWRRRAEHAETQVINVKITGSLLAELQGADGVWRTYYVS